MINRILNIFNNYYLRLNGYGTGWSLQSSGELKAFDNYIENIKEYKEIIVFDVGANVGKFVSHALSFEPSSRAFSELSKINDNRHKSTNMGLSSLSGIDTLYTNRFGAEISSLNRVEYQGSKSMNKEEKVQLMTLDEFVYSERIDKIDYLKLDVEGHEYEVLKGAKDALNARMIKAIQFEMGPPNIYSKVFFKDFYDLLSPNFEVYRISKSKLYPIIEYSPKLEVFLTTNYICFAK